MRIAIAHDNGMVSEHFGHAPEFIFIDIEEGKVISKQTVKSPSHGHGIVPHFLARNNVKVVIAGGMGHGAIAQCQHSGIEPFTAIKGNVDEVVEKFLKGELKSETIPCEGFGHRHHGECGHREEF